VSWDVVCVGESMGVLSPDPPVSLREGATLRLGVAGAESNVAIWLARLAASATGPALRVAWRGRVGADPFGAMIGERLAIAGVDTGLAETDPGHPTGVYFKDPAPGGGTRVHYYRRGSAASRMDRRMLDGLAGTGVIHLSGITAALSESCADLVTHALVDRPVAGALMSFDVNYRPALWPVEVAGPALEKLAAAADLVFVGRDEAEVLWGTATAEQIRAWLPEPATLVVKDGGVGATVFGADGRYEVATPPVDVVEPVGAGDAFAAGYLWARLGGAGPQACLRLGHLIAGCALRSTDDLGDPPPATELRMRLGIVDDPV
jgi:2-dehydro-3-deoxygluconokinase